MVDEGKYVLTDGWIVEERMAIVEFLSQSVSQ